MEAIEILIPIYKEMINKYLSSNNDNHQYIKLNGFNVALTALGWTAEQDNELINQVHQERTEAAK